MDDEPNPDHRIDDPGRVAAVASTGLLDTPREEAFDRLTRLASDLIGAPMVFVTLVDDQVSYWKSTTGVDDGTPQQRPASQSFCRFVITTGAEQVIPDTRVDARTRGMDAVASMNIKAWAGIPIRAASGDVLGTFCAMDIRPREWTHRQLEILRTLSQAAGGEIALRMALQEARHASAAAERHAADAERHAARAERSAAEATELAETLQQSLLPAGNPRIPGMEVAARYRPGGGGAEVLGDFYDVFPVPGGWGVVVGDVCGKGPWAARTTALARSTVRAVGHTEDDTGAVLAALNDVLHVWFAGRHSFVTATYATMTAADEGLNTVVVNGGHPPAFLLRADGEVRQFADGGRALGLRPDAAVGREEECLKPGDSLVFYTDGVTESRPPGSTDLFGEDGVARVLASLSPAAGAEAVAEAVSRAALDHAGGQVADDTAIVVVRSPQSFPTPEPA
ncbi:SpoIIE family protein phosphatase [Actinomycetospora lutea]|uniref:PP2C family protein-serine/threonine phosphatase n=1 Tax=Actinomycetospora lutea TaxID=663604 RepID=UPI002366A904|nr:GAF domain-containing SpoIIE family protein phosphatase [Actinomycetospora lutea]MDD7940318.1 SpoIIE family protein phosphatase [Actinomycetospora lutea]